VGAVIVMGYFVGMASPNMLPCRVASAGVRPVGLIGAFVAFGGRVEKTPSSSRGHLPSVRVLPAPDDLLQRSDSPTSRLRTYGLPVLERTSAASCTPSVRVNARGQEVGYYTKMKSGPEILEKDTDIRMGRHIRGNVLIIGEEWAPRATRPAAVHLRRREP